MARYSRSLLTVGGIATALIAAAVLPALGDDLENQLVAPDTVTVAAGLPATVGFTLRGAGGDGGLQGGGTGNCNVAGANDGRTATVTFTSSPAGVTTPTLTFDTCGTVVNGTFSAPVGTYLVTANTPTNVGGAAGSYTVSAASFTLIVTPSNVAPTVQTAASDSAGNEGQLLSTSGAFADANGVSGLTITKQSGAGTVTPNGSGTWSWSHTSNDQDSGSVTVRATDPGGLLVEDTFTWAAANVAPTIVSDAGNVSGVEGVQIVNSGSFTDVAADTPLTITKTAGPGSVTPGPGDSWSWSHTPGDQTAGPVTVSVRADDGDGGTITDSFTFTADNVDPTVTTPAPDVDVDEGQLASTAGVFADVAADALSISHSPPSIGDIASAVSGAWSWSWQSTDDASGAVDVTAEDGDGGSAVDSFNYLVRNLDPVSVIAPSDAAGVEGGTLSTSGSFADPGDDTITIAQGVGDAGTLTDNGDGTFSWQYAADDDGAGSVTVTATDDDSGQTSVTFDWTAENVDPAIANAADDATGDEGSTLTASGRFTDVAADPITVSKLSGPGDVVDNGDGTWSWSLATTDVDSGVVEVRATDGDGGATVDTFSFVATDVATTVKNAASNANGDEGDLLSTDGSFEAGAFDLITVNKLSGEGTVVDNGDGTWSWSLATTDDVSGSVTVQAEDDEGNLVEDTFTYSAADVLPEIVDDAQNQVGDEGDTLTNAGAFSAMPSDGVIVSSVDPNVVVTGLTWTWTLPTDDNVSGTVEVTATDDDGNAVTDSFDYATDNVAPDVVGDAADVAGIEGVEMTTSGSFTDVAGDLPLAITHSGPGTLTQLGDGGWEWSYTPADQDLVGQTVTVTADDGDGASTTDTFLVTAVNADPTVTLAADDVTVDEGQTAETAGAFSDVLADPLTVTHSPSIGDLTANTTGAWSWSWLTADDADGDITVTADDGDGGSKSDTFHYTVNNVPPSLQGSVVNPVGEEGTELTTSGAFTDPGADTLTIEKSSGAGDVIDNGDGTFSWTFTPGDNGTGDVTVTATDDDGGEVSTTFTWTAVNVEPTVAEAAVDVSLPEGSTLTASGSFDDVPADDLTITSDALVGELTVDGRSWSWSRPTTGVESGSITVTATDDDGGSISDSFDYEATNVVPTVADAATPNPATGVEGDTLAAIGSFDSATVDTLTVEKVSGAGSVVDNGEGSWSWSFATTDNGGGSVTVLVTDDDGSTAEDTFSWSVSNASPVIGSLQTTGASGTGCISGNDVTLSFTVDDLGADDTITGVVAWGDGETSTFSGRSVELEHSYVAGTYTIAVNADDDDGASAIERTTQVSRNYALSAFMPPVNNDGSSVFKAGSTVPVKIRVTDCDGVVVPGLSPSILTQKSSSTVPPVGINEAVGSTSAADTTGFMRYDGAGQYIYNLSTKLLPDPTATYWLEVKVGGAAQQVKFGLRNK